MKVSVYWVHNLFTAHVIGKVLAKVQLHFYTTAVELRNDDASKIANASWKFTKPILKLAF